MNQKKKYCRHVSGIYAKSIGILLFMIFFLFAFSSVFSQMSYGGRPSQLNTTDLREIPVIRMPLFDIHKYLRDLESEAESRLKPMVFAKPFDLDVDPEKDGEWTETEDGSRIWRVILYSRGALSMNIIFSKFMLKEGVSVFVYDTRRTDVKGSFDRRNNQLSGSLAVAPVRGDRLIVEMQVEPGISDFGELVIGRLNHDFRGIIGSKDGQFGLSGDCNIDISCPPGNQWQTEKNAVVRLYINGIELCTGVLVNNTANDGKPYLLTAHHCVPDSANAANTVFVFGYESLFCNGEDGSVINSLSGSDLLATQENLDFSLLILRDTPPRSYQPWYAGWDRSGQTPESTVSIHHPNGDVKKISVDNDPPLTNTFEDLGEKYTQNGHWKIEKWEMGTTEGGSSGSPLFQNNGQVIGLLTGGDARCGFSENDYYSKFSLAWDLYEGDSSQLKPWLDSLGTDIQSVQGINPYLDSALQADFQVSTTEICEGDEVVFTDFSSGSINSWHWDFGEGAFPAFANTRGPHLVEYTGSSERVVSLTVGNKNGSDIMEKVSNLTVKSTELPVAGFSYTEDELTVQFNDMAEYAVSYYWEFGNKSTSTQSNPVHTYQAEGEYNVKQLVRNQACSDTSVQTLTITTTSAGIEPPVEGIQVYPVPANDFIAIDFGQSATAETVIEMFSSTGNLLERLNLSDKQASITIDTSGYPSGIYILRILTGNVQNIYKIPVLR